MATTWTTADLTKIERAIATGALSVSYDDGRRVIYRSLEDMRSVRDEIAGALDPARRGPHRKVMAHSKGVEAGGAEPFDWGS